MRGGGQGVARVGMWASVKWGVGKGLWGLVVEQLEACLVEQKTGRWGGGGE